MLSTVFAVGDMSFVGRNDKHAMQRTTKQYVRTGKISSMPKGVPKDRVHTEMCLTWRVTDQRTDNEHGNHRGGGLQCNRSAWEASWD